MAHVPGVDENLPNQPLARHHERVRTDPADVAGVAQRYRPDAVLPGLVDGQPRGKGGAHLPHGAASVNHRQARLVAHHLGHCLRLKAALANRLGVFVKPNGAVRVVAEQVGLDQVVDDRPGVLGPTSEGGEKRVADCPQIGRVEAWHVRSFLSVTCWFANRI